MEALEQVRAYHVNRQQENDGLGEEHTNGTRQILLNELLEVDFDFLLFGVDAPVLRAAAEVGGFVHQYDGRIRLFEEDEGQNQAQEAHNCRDVLGPSPAKVRLVDESANERG